MNEKESKLIIAATRDKFFVHRKWQRKKCPICLKDYYTKQDLPHCGSYRCMGKYQFLDTPAPKTYLEFDACIKKLRRFFSGRNYKLVSPIEIVRNNERTLFASTAGQIYDDLIYGQSSRKESKRCAVVQPVIRLQGADFVSSRGGFSTSFVHAATECWNVTMDEHFNALDEWLDFLSSVSFYVGGLCFKIECVDNNWAGRIVTSEMLKINYSGLEIGVSNFFFNIPQFANETATLSDTGVGLERLIWAVNKSLDYFDCMGPLSSVIIHKRVVLDAIRTATLMVSSGVMPDHKNQGSKLRSMVGLIVPEVQCLNLYELVCHYYKQWNFLIDLPVSRKETYSIIWREINRGLNLRTNRLLKIEEPFEQGHEEFLRKVVQKKVVSIARLRSIEKDNLMNTKITHIFLGGGGDAKESRLLDEQFVKTIDSAKPLIYIPNAMRSKSYQACLEWFTSVMNSLGITAIEMWDDFHIRHSIDDIAGLYIGGGDTVKLLEEIRSTDFDNYLIKMVQNGIPLYGGSAGAIVLGENIRTAPEAQLETAAVEGLGIVKGHSILCHYKSDECELAKKFSKELHQNIIAIPEKAGAYLTGKRLINYGTEQLVVVQGNKIRPVNPGNSINLKE